MNLDGTNNDRPNLISSPLLSANHTRAETTATWFKPATFVRGANGTTGKAGRNIIDGPGAKNLALVL